jgi:phosphatidylglycerophosphate synthase
MAHRMIDRVTTKVIITAEPESAFVELCGISMLERLLRILQRLGVAQVSILSASPDAVRQHLARLSWARADVRFDIVRAVGRTVTTADIRNLAGSDDAPMLLVDGSSFFDARLLRVLMRTDRPALLIDSAPPPDLIPLLKNVPHVPAGYICGTAIFSTGLLGDDETESAFESLAHAKGIDLIDVHEQPTYIVDMRRRIRPLWFPAPERDNAIAEQLLLDAAQNGTLDLPAIAHAPIETAIIRRLCRTSITPTQITLFTAVVSSVVTALFATGQLLLGTSLALIVGVLDGLDGKQARVKVETTELGKREHVLDYVLELSWWIALAYHFASTGALASASALTLLLITSDLVDRYAKRIAKQRTGRNLDDVAPIDRFVRLIGGRRNIYIWILAGGLIAGAADNAFALLCYWGAGTAAVHLLRALWIARQPHAV